MGDPRGERRGGVLRAPHARYRRTHRPRRAAALEREGHARRAAGARAHRAHAADEGRVVSDLARQRAGVHIGADAWAVHHLQWGGARVPVQGARRASRRARIAGRGAHLTARKGSPSRAKQKEWRDASHAIAPLVRSWIRRNAGVGSGAPDARRSCAPSAQASPELGAVPSCARARACANEAVGEAESQMNGQRPGRERAWRATALAGRARALRAAQRRGWGGGTHRRRRARAERRALPRVRASQPAARAARPRGPPQGGTRPPRTPRV